MKENERKYLIDNVEKQDIWDREHIIYQWYIEADNKHSIKKKIIFDLTQARIIYVQIEKEKIDWGKSNKKVSYLDVKEFHPNDFLGIPFVLKRRAIKDKIFLDKFIRSNNLTQYLLEFEGEDYNDLDRQNFLVLRDVTEDFQYYNQNMCVPFEKDDAENLSFLFNIFKI